MNSLGLVLIVLMAFASSQGSEIVLSGNDRSISSIILEAIENIQVQMEEGWPQYGIPPMAPLKVNHKDFHFNSGELNVDGELDNIVVNGLNEFEVVQLHVKTVSRRIDYEFNFGSLNLTTQYKTDISRMHRDGGAFLALENLNIKGFIKYSLGLLTKYVRVKEIKVNVTLGNAVSQIQNLSKYRIVNRKMNEIIEEFIQLTINDNTDFVADWIDDTVTPTINDMIGDRTLLELLAIIGGGGGGSGKNISN